MSLILGDLVHFSKKTGFEFGKNQNDTEDSFTQVREKISEAETKDLITNEVAILEREDRSKVSKFELNV